MAPPGPCLLHLICAQPLFRRAVAPTEQVRESQRDIRKGTREIEREIMELKREEANLIREIKAAAKTGNQASLKVLAKSLVRVRTQMGKLQGSIAQLKGVSTQMTVSATCGVGVNREVARWRVFWVRGGRGVR